MDESRRQPRRDRPVFVDLLIIGAAIAALMYGGLQLLGKTRHAWEAREADKAEAVATANAIAEETAKVDAARRRLEAIRAERSRIELEQARQKNRRCVGGVLFAEIDGVLTNVGRC